MNYCKIHDNIISAARKRIIIDGYYEKHHILPRSMGGLNRKDNIVFLTAKEHYIVHHLLSKIYPTEKMIRAFFLMCKKNIHYNQQRNYAVTAIVYEKAKEEFSRIHSLRMSGENNPNFGKSMSDEQKNKISLGNKGKRKGIKSSTETKLKQLNAKMGKIRGPNKNRRKDAGISTGRSPANKGISSPLKGYPRGTKIKDITHDQSNLSSI